MGRLGEPADEGLLTYGEYLAVPELIALQRLRSDPPVHDELLFIVVHQAYELWFKQLIFELESVRDQMIDGDPERARHYLTRVHAIERVLIDHIQVLETMTPQDFLEFRSLLTPASGFQSVQFREVEFISGLKQRGYLRDLAAPPEDLGRLARRLEEPTVWDGFVTLLERDGLEMPASPSEPICSRSPSACSITTKDSPSGATTTCSWSSARSAPSRGPVVRPASSTCVRRCTSGSSPSCGACARTSRATAAPCAVEAVGPSVRSPSPRSGW